MKILHKQQKPREYISIKTNMTKKKDVFNFDYSEKINYPKSKMKTFCFLTVAYRLDLLRIYLMTDFQTENSVYLNSSLYCFYKQVGQL